MQPYEVSFEDTDKRILVVANDTGEAYSLLDEHLKDNKELRDKKRSITYAPEREMKQRFIWPTNRWHGRESHWKIYQRCRRKGESRVVGEYLM